MNYHDAFGVPGVVTRMFNNYGPRQNPRYVTGTIITQALDARAGRARRARAAARLLLLHGRRARPPHGRREGVPGDVYVYGQGKNISMADWADLILRVGTRAGLLGDDREIVTTPARLRPGSSDVMALRVGYEKLHARDGLGTARLLGGRRAADDRLVCREPRPLDRPRRLARRRRRPPRDAAAT